MCKGSCRSWQRGRLAATTSLQSNEAFLRNAELSRANPLQFQWQNNHDTRRHHTPCTSRTSHLAGFVLSRRRLGAIQCHSRPNLTALDEGCPLNISPDGQLFDQRGVSRPSKQSTGYTTVLSTIHMGTKRGEELKKSSPQRLHPCVTTTVHRLGQGEREGPISRGSLRVSGAGRAGEVHIR